LASRYGPGVDSASNRNEYQEYFLGGKGGRCVGLTTLPPSCRNLGASTSWNPKALSRPVMGLLFSPNSVSYNEKHPVVTMETRCVFVSPVSLVLKTD
jgi:hypothetical protein